MESVPPSSLDSLADPWFAGRRRGRWRVVYKRNRVFEAAACSSHGHPVPVRQKRRSRHQGDAAGHHRGRIQSAALSAGDAAGQRDDAIEWAEGRDDHIESADSELTCEQWLES